MKLAYLGFTLLVSVAMMVSAVYAATPLGQLISAHASGVWSTIFVYRLGMYSVER